MQLVNKEAEIKWMEQLRETKVKEPAKVYLRKLQEEGFEDEKDLEDLYKRTVKTLQQARDRELGIEEPAEKVSQIRYDIPLLTSFPQGSA